MESIYFLTLFTAKLRNNDSPKIMSTLPSIVAESHFPLKDIKVLLKYNKIKEKSIQDEHKSLGMKTARKA